ncbi:MAG TPA: hypothetical protein VFE50_03255 [Cyclobacteriaceae bacterium]|nr:hypothetical protein [Cyclobacteriaceae bacterium]
MKLAILKSLILILAQTAFAQIKTDLSSFPEHTPFDRAYYNEASKNEVLKRLQNTWTDEEKHELSQQAARAHFETEIAELRQLLERRDLSEGQGNKIKQQLDTLQMIINTNRITHPLYRAAVEAKMKAIDRHRVDDRLILLAGFLDDKRYVPVLRNAIGDSIHYAQHHVKLALARLNEEPFYSEMIAFYRVDYNKIQKLKSDHYELNQYFFDLCRGLLYIRSQESILELGNFLSAELKVTDPVAINSEDVGYSPVSRQAFEAITRLLNNEDIKAYLKSNPKELNVNPIQRTVSQEAPISKRHVIWLDNWMKKNFGRYEILRD